jgi:hypothetical protein
VRISTTTLESFRLYMQPDQEWMSEDDLLATIRGEFAGNHKVWLGSAYGSILEHPERYRINGGYRVQPRGCEYAFTLGDDVMGPALALIDRPRTVFEAKGVKRYGNHEVVAKADQIVGACIRETKSTLSSFDFDKYAASCQWRFMLDIFGARSVTYDVACLFESAQNSVIELRGIETFTFYPYPEMQTDLRELLAHFVDYVDARGMRAYLTPLPLGGPAFEDLPTREALRM